MERSKFSWSTKHLIFGKKVRYQLRSVERIKSAIDREKYHDDIMAVHENDDVMFNKLIKSERKQASQEVHELIYDGERYRDNLLWTKHFSSLAQPQEIANCDDEIQQQAKIKGSRKY